MIHALKKECSWDLRESGSVPRSLQCILQNYFCYYLDEGCGGNRQAKWRRVEEPDRCGVEELGRGRYCKRILRVRSTVYLWKTSTSVVPHYQEPHSYVPTFWFGQREAAGAHTIIYKLKDSSACTDCTVRLLKIVGW